MKWTSNLRDTTILCAGGGGKLDDTERLRNTFSITHDELGMDYMGTIGLDQIVLSELPQNDTTRSFSDSKPP